MVLELKSKFNFSVSKLTLFQLQFVGFLFITRSSMGYVSVYIHVKKSMKTRF